MVISATYSGLYDFDALLVGFNDLDDAILKFDSTAYGDPRIDHLQFIGEVTPPVRLPLPGGALAGLLALRRRCG